METRLVKIDEVCEITSSKRIFAKEYIESGIPFYRGKEVTEKYKGNLNVTTELFISEQKYEEIKAKHGVPVAGDMLLTSVGTLGSTYIVRPTDKFYFKDGNLTWFRNFNGLNSKYLKYWLESPVGKGELKKSIIGSSQSAYTIANLKQMQISLPSEEEQQQVVDVLEAYDNLIENNNRRIAILEEIAQSLYREWFVKFRFPGHENAKFIDSPLGKIPEGWEVRILGELVNFKRASVRKGGLEEPTPYMGLEHFPRKSIALSNWDMVTEIGSSKLAFNKGDILFGKIRPYFHKVGVAQVDGICSSDTFVLEPTEQRYHPLVSMVTFSEDFVSHSVQTSQGTKMPRANWDVLSQYQVTIPDDDILGQFNDIVADAISNIRLLGLKNNNLVRQRDVLLPKLIGGNLSI